MGGKIVAGLVGLVVVIVIAAVIEYAGLALDVLNTRTCCD